MSNLEAVIYILKEDIAELEWDITLTSYLSSNKSPRLLGLRKVLKELEKRLEIKEKELEEIKNETV